MNKLFSVCFISLLFALAGCSSLPKQGISSEDKELGHDMSSMPGHQHQHQHETADGDYLKAEPMPSNFGGPYQPDTRR